MIKSFLHLLLDKVPSFLYFVPKRFLAFGRDKENSSQQLRRWTQQSDNNARVVLMCKVWQSFKNWLDPLFIELCISTDGAACSQLFLLSITLLHLVS